MSKWIKDRVFKDVGMSLEVSETLFEGKTKYQKIEVYNTPRMGRVLVLDDAIQTTERDEFTYHEMMVHVPINAHGNVKSVLIVGGGDGGALEEVMKHQSIEKVTMVEIDQEVIDVSRKYLPSISKNAFGDSRLNLVIADAVEWVKNATEKFDIILLDRTDAIDGAVEICGQLYSRDFYRNCAKLMTERGIMVAQAGMITFSGKEIISDLETASQCWRKASIFITSVPAYSGGFQAMLWAANWNITTMSEADIKQRQSLPDLQYYTPEIHRASFVLPKFALAY